MAAARMLVLLVLALLIPACSESLEILGPTPAGEGITIYLHADYAGPSQAINRDLSDLEKVEGPCTHGGEGEKPTWSDCMSSVRVEPGWSVTLYRDDDFKGRSVTLTADTPNLKMLPGPCDGSFNDCVSSMRVTKTQEDQLPTIPSEQDRQDAHQNRRAAASLGFTSGIRIVRTSR